MRYVYMNQMNGGLDQSGKPTHCLTYSRKVATHRLSVYGGSIYRLSYGYFKDCGHVMDAPTFRVVSDRIA